MIMFIRNGPQAMLQGMKFGKTPTLDEVLQKLGTLISP